MASAVTASVTMRQAGRAIALAALLAVAATIAILLLGDTDPYDIHAEFENAGQVVPGGEVRIAGRRVGTVVSLGVTPSGLADLHLEVTDGDYSALPAGTRATIRAVGQAGVANHFVDLAPGPGGAGDIPDGGTLPLRQTTGIVDLDDIFNSLDAGARNDIRTLIDRSADVFAGTGAADVNAMLTKLDPALRELDGAMRELAADRGALRTLVASGAASARALADRRDDLGALVTDVGRAFRAFNSERTALTGVLTRAAPTVRQSTQTLRDVSRTVAALRPTLRAVAPAAGPLKRTLRDSTAMLRRTTPVVAELNEQLPGLRRGLSGLVGLKRPAVRALGATTGGLKAVMPILRGTRIYGSDLFLGLFNGLAGLSGGTYQGGGHYLHVEFVQSLQGLLEGQFAPLLQSGSPLLPGVLQVRTKLDRQCPGGAAPPADDGSSPWIPDPSLCDPEDDLPGGVNSNDR